MFVSESFFKIQSSIHSQLMKSSLFKGTFIAAIGALVMVYTGTFLSPSELTKYGFFFFATGCGLITFGLLPYRKLCALEKSPHEMYITQGDQLFYFSNRRRVFSLSLEMIEMVSYVDDSSHYGILINLKDHIAGKGVIFEPLFASLYHRNSSGKGYLFLPYFSKRSCELLSSTIEGQRT